MTQYEREELVERYLNGDMTSAQEGEFFLVAAVDEELQRTLKAYRIMDRAMTNDRDTAVVENSQYRGRVMGMLAASHIVGAGSAANSGGTPGGTAPMGGAGGGGAAAGAGFWKGIGAAVVGASIVAGTIVGISSLNDRQQDPAPAAVRQQTVPQSVSPASPAPSEEQAAPVTGESVPTMAAPHLKESTASRPAERVAEKRQSGVDAESAVKSATTPRAIDVAVPKKKNSYITLPPTENDKVQIPVQVEDPAKK